MNKVCILGLADSWSLYEHDGRPTFGVNDIWRYFKTDYVVCVDQMRRFPDRRLHYIINSEPKKFYSQHTEWAGHPRFEKIELSGEFPKDTVDVDNPRIPKSVFSPYIAIIKAWQLYRPDVIDVYGVDMTNHRHLSAMEKHIRKHWRALLNGLSKKNCEVVVHGNSILWSSTVKKM